MATVVQVARVAGSFLGKVEGPTSYLNLSTYLSVDCSLF